jgi:hypothetical protein
MRLAVVPACLLGWTLNLAGPSMGPAARAAGSARATAAAVAAARSDGASQKISVELRGPLALVQITRRLPREGDGWRGRRAAPAAAQDQLLDVALPDRAALLSVELNDRGRWQTVAPADAGHAREDYQAALDARAVAATQEPFDDDTRFRVRVARGAARPTISDAATAGAAPAPTQPLLLRYRFSALVEYTHGRYRLRFPPSPEASPPPAEVTVSGAALADLEIAGVRSTFPAHPAAAALGGDAYSRTAGRVSTRSGWEISYTLATRPPAAGAPSTGPTLEGSAAAAPISDRESAIAFSVHARARGRTPLPDNLLLLIDRSRSVGLPGLAAEHDLATRLLERLPPSTRFDALFFDRAVARLFPMVRPATREAIGAIEAEMTPDRLANGTDLPGALHAAGELLRRESIGFAPRTLLVLITDGALPEGQTGPALDAALGAIPGLDLSVALLVVRPRDEESVTAAARLALEALAQARGGLERELRADDIDETVASVLDVLAEGGDVFAARVIAGGAGARLAGPLAPDSGVTGVARVAGRIRRAGELSGIARGRTARAPLELLEVNPAWLRPHAAVAETAAPVESRLLSTPGLLALVEPISRPAAPAAPSATARGSMDRGVVRNTLSLAFMPRARACYQNRPGSTPEMRDLTGRVRLAIELVRGEVVDARVESSTLNQPQIEACLRDGAFALEVPRAYRNDEPVTAVVNLVFRPRTPEKKHSAEDSFPIGAEIDLILEQLKREELKEEQPKPPEPEPAPQPKKSEPPQSAR